MTKPNKKKIIFTGIGLLALVAIIVFVYLFVVGRPFYKLKNFEKDDVTEITLIREPHVGYINGEKPKSVTIYYNEKANSTEFNEINDMLSELRFGIGISNEWRTDYMKNSGGGYLLAPYYEVRITTKGTVKHVFFFFEDDANKIKDYSFIHGKVYRKGVFSKLDLKKYFSEVE